MWLQPDKKQPSYDFSDYLRSKLGVQPEEELPVESDRVEAMLAQIFTDSDDFTSLHSVTSAGQKVSHYYISGLIDITLLHASLIQPFIERNERDNRSRIRHVKDVVYSLNVREPAGWQPLIQDCLRGMVVCHVDGLRPVSIEIGKAEKRSINEPGTEYQVYGPKLGFIENIKTNISILRGYIRDPRLKLKQFRIGSLSHTSVAVMYLDEYVDKDMLKQVLDRLGSIETDNLVNGNQLEHFLVDYPMSIFPQMKKTERPDYCSYALSQGKIIIITDNSTFSQIIPTTLMEFYETSEDRYYKIWTRTFIRLLRFACLFIAAVIPAMYVALVAFHPELLPTTLALTLAESRSKIPFPATVEAFILLFAFDVLIEAAMRLPSVVGQTIGIVGAIVLGTAAVEAGVVSNVLVIVISFTAIAAFTVPSWELVQSWRLVRYFLFIVSSLLGLYGLILGISLVTIHLCHLQSFSKPYYSPFSPLKPKEFVNIFIRWYPRRNK